MNTIDFTPVVGGGWGAVLNLARRYGWQPAPTGSPRGTLAKDWDGSYFSNAGQLFYARDARKLANASERAVEEMPSEKLKKDSSNWLFTNAGKETIQQFINFCRAGSFRID